MTITKVLTIKSRSGIEKVVTYIKDIEKTHINKLDFSSFTLFDPQHFITSGDKPSKPQGDYAREIFVDEKTGKITPLYVTAHLCQPDSVTEDFMAAAAFASFTKATAITAPIAHQFVQSFEDDIDLSDEKVHQCGLQLGDTLLHEYPYLMTSHVHPILDEEGKLHGTHKHNHFLVCAYKAPEFCTSPAIKLNSNRDLLDDLRICNDCVAIEHGLTIVRDPDIHRSRSWYQEILARQDLSWVERTRQIVDSVKCTTRSWEAFLEKLAETGYTVRQGAHLIYIAPDGQEIRADHLGQEYTEPAVRGHWALMGEVQTVLEDFIQARPPARLRDLMDVHGTLYVDIPVGIPKPGRHRHYQPLSLKKPHHKKEVLASYFDPLRWYAIKDKHGNVITQMTGHYVIDYIESTRRGDIPDWSTTKKPSRKAYKTITGYWHVGKGFQTDLSAEHYRVCLQNTDGSCRSPLEVALRLIAVAFLGERVYRRELDPPQKPEYLLTQEVEWQPILDAMRIMREEHAKTVDDLIILCESAKEKHRVLSHYSDSLHRSKLSKEEEQRLLSQKAGLKTRITRLERAIKYANMTFEQAAEEYIPKQLNLDIPAPPTPQLTHLDLDSIIKSASSRVSSSPKSSPHKAYSHSR